MPIQSGDVKLVASEVMLDVENGGGAPTDNIINDGVSNAIFPDISELDRAGGRVSLRKVFASVQTDDTDTYFGGNVIVADPPADPRVSVTLFSTNNVFDRRPQAAQRIESYLTQGPEWGGYLFENHIIGQRAIQLFQRVGSALPTVGQTLVLIENTKQQYVRVTRVNTVVRQFYDAARDRDYEAWIVTLDISDALRFDFTGSPARREFTRAANTTVVRDTLVADAGTYAGVTSLDQPASIGDFTVDVASVFTNLVPSAQTETPITFAPPYAASGLPVPNEGPVRYVTSVGFNTSNSMSLPGGCLPGSLTITLGTTTITDSNGSLLVNGAQVGTIDYANGTLTALSGSFDGTKTVTYTPAARVLRMPQSSESRVTAATRSLNYTGVLEPVPQPGTLSVSYLAQGRWYVLSDQGDGQLRGLDPSFGAGTLNRTTGAYVVTLGALPDVNSSVIFTWNSPTQETRLPFLGIPISQTVTLSPPANEMIQPGTLTLSWSGDTATTNAAGVISGAATGTVSVSRNEVTFRPSALPTVGALITVNYVSGPKQEDNFAYPARNGSGQIPVTTSQAGITPGSLEVEWNTFTDEAVLGVYTREQIEEMALQLVDPIHIARDNGAGAIVLNGNTIGSVNYSTGAVVFNPDVVIKIPRPQYVAVPVNGRFRLVFNGIEYVDAPSLYPNDTTGFVKVRYNSSVGSNNRSETFEFRPKFRVVPEVNAELIPGSLLLSDQATRLVSGSTSFNLFGDNGLGTLRQYTDTGWVNRGTIDYLTGEVTLTSWPAGFPSTINRLAGVTTAGQPITDEVVFRTAVAPLRPASLSVVFARAGGGTVNVTADASGNFSGTNVTGTVDYETGVVRLRFGQMVAAAGNESEPWYNAAAVTGGQIFRPAPVAIGSLRYNAVAFTYLPLDANLLGIDPVRLPQDGRVPIFRPGGFAVVGNTASITATVSNGQTINCGRVRLSRVRVVGQNGQVINTGFTTNLDAGTVTFTDVTGYSQPVTIEHRIEDMGVIREVDISGQVSFTRPLTHNYPAGSFVSTALISGDLQARVTTPFDQVSWNGTWSDALVGSAAVAQFNSVLAPIEVTNRGAITERWVIRFTNSTAFEVIGENVGVIATGNVTTDCSPLNPATNVPYFTIRAIGWGSGWATGNVLRFNTVGSLFPVWVVRTVQQGPETVTEDSFTLLIRGDVNRP